MDEFYMEYDDLVDSGDIDPREISIEDYVEDRLSSLIDNAEYYYDIER